MNIDKTKERKIQSNNNNNVQIIIGNGNKANKDQRMGDTPNKEMKENIATIQERQNFVEFKSRRT